LNKLSKEKTPQ